MSLWEPWVTGVWSERDHLDKHNRIAFLSWQRKRWDHHVTHWRTFLLLFVPELFLASHVGVLGTFRSISVLTGFSQWNRKRIDLYIQEQSSLMHHHPHPLPHDPRETLTQFSCPSVVSEFVLEYELGSCCVWTDTVILFSSSSSVSFFLFCTFSSLKLGLRVLLCKKWMKRTKVVCPVNCQTTRDLLLPLLLLIVFWNMFFTSVAPVLHQWLKNREKEECNSFRYWYRMLLDKSRWRRTDHSLGLQSNGFSHTCSFITRLLRHIYSLPRHPMMFTIEYSSPASLSWRPQTRGMRRRRMSMRKAMRERTFGLCLSSSKVS